MTKQSIPHAIETEAELERRLAKPASALVDRMRKLDGDIMILGVAGKMGVSLAALARAAIAEAGTSRTVFGVARFSDTESRTRLDSLGVKTIRCDLLDRDRVAELPPTPNVLFLAGRKFGTAGSQALTWAMNTSVPANVAHHFRSSKIVAFSTGCVYPLVTTDSPPSEDVAAAPIGEYAQSCLGRERIFEYQSEATATPVCIYRLNYAIDLRYGVLHDIAQQIWQNKPVDNTVGAFNVIWQGDANHQALMCLSHCTSPANVLNVTGPETLRTEDVALQIGELMSKPVSFSGEPGTLSYLSDSTKATKLFGEPSVTAQDLIRWQAHWVMNGGRSLNKPTHFEVSNGDF